MKGKNKFNKLYNIIFPIAVFLIILAVWAFSAAKVNEEFIMPKVSSAFKELGVLLGSGVFYASLGWTLLRTFLAFAVSFILAFALAVLSRLFVIAEKIIKPFVAVIRALPTAAVILWFVLWLDSNVAAAMVTCLVIFPTVFNGIYTSFDEIDKDNLEMLKIYKVKRSKVFSKYILPVITPTMLLHTGSGLSLNLKLMVSAEVLAQAGKSIGYMMNESKIYFLTARLMALTVFTVILALLIEVLFSFISRLISSRWKK